MKVLMLGWELPPYNSGGLGVACYQLCQSLSKKAVDIEFILPYTADFSAVDFMKVRPAHPQGVEAIMRSGVAYDSYRYIFTDGHEELFTIFDQQKAYETAVGQLVPSLDFDVVHAHDWLTFRAALRTKQQSGKPLIVHAHSIESDRAGKEGGGNPLVREIESLGMLLADRVIAVSQWTKDAIVREYDIPADKIDVLHNSIDPAWYQSLDDNSAHRYLSAMKAQGYRVVVNVGRLTIQKGLPNLLRAAKEVIQRAPKTLFLIVGSGEQYTELIELAADLGISKNVLFTDFQRGKNLRDSFAIGDLFVLPSVSEPFGLTPFEAAIYGTPSLVSKQSGISEVFQNCLKVDFWDINEMANQIVSVVREDVLRDELQANAAREYQRLSWEGAADALTNWYHHHHKLHALSEVGSV
ncbi:MAG TPA: glycosyltransferase family 4 protein [Verrucomicrobiae bacterium]|nr:glycosyltransferase family 4 protein [Verrucomicrobiae bacterium]